jgi:hypothetical protein
MITVTADKKTVCIDGKGFKLPFSDDKIKFVIQRNDRKEYLYIFTSSGYGGQFFKCRYFDEELTFLQCGNYSSKINAISIVSYASTPIFRREIHEYKYGFLYCGNLLGSTKVNLITINDPLILYDDVANDMYEAFLKSNQKGDLANTYSEFNSSGTFDEFRFDETGCNLNLYYRKLNHDKKIVEDGLKFPTIEKGRVIGTIDLTKRLTALGIDLQETLKLQQEYSIYTF